jgi:hypothetical protein
MVNSRMPEIGMDRQPPPSLCFCEERYRLLDEFLNAIRELNLLQTRQTRAVISGEPDFTRFDTLIYLAQERKDAAKYRWIAHIKIHHCEEKTWA